MLLRCMRTCRVEHPGPAGHHHWLPIHHLVWQLHGDPGRACAAATACHHTRAGAEGMWFVAGAVAGCCALRVGRELVKGAIIWLIRSV